LDSAAIGADITGISGNCEGLKTRSGDIGSVALGAARVTVSLSDPLVIVACIKEIAAMTVAPTIPVAAITETSVLFLFMYQECQSER
jgi:hypothetical protein